MTHHTGDDDAEILALARSGRRSDALALFQSRHGARLGAACRRLAGSHEDGEDAFQETLLQVDRSLGSFRGDSSLYTFAFRIALNVCLNQKRGLRARARHVPVNDAGLVAGERDGGDPDTFCVSTFRAQVVERSLLGLPEGQRQALALVDLEEMTAAEAGALLGIDPNAVKQRVHRARKALRERIARAFAAKGVELSGFEEIGCVSGLFEDRPGRPAGLPR